MQNLQLNSSVRLMSPLSYSETIAYYTYTDSKQKSDASVLDRYELANICYCKDAISV